MLGEERESLPGNQYVYPRQKKGFGLLGERITPYMKLKEIVIVAFKG